ncbi:MAG: RNA-binding S4 domain-containing protein [Alphaproteobacteria bacterium]|nr:RNA-binding S4 domain-containing protein [Alphaproteobacteria bacterium]
MSIRIDKWLWHARFFRTRAAAQHAAQSGLLRLNGRRVEKPSSAVHCGDVLTIARGHEIAAVRVLAEGTHRGQASEAKTLYEYVENTALDRDAPAP